MGREVAQYCLIAVLSALVGCEDGTLLSVDVAPTMAAFAASPSLVVSGSPTEVTWTWSYANTPQETTCSVDQGVGTITPGDKTSVTLTDDTVFTLTCTNGAGAATSQTTIEITPEAMAPTIASFTAEPALAISGQETEVTWTWSYANTPTPVPECSIDQGVGTLDPEGKTSVTLSEDTVFTLTCSNSAGSDTAQTTIATTSVAVAPAIAGLAATPSAVVSGSATDVTWVWSYANTPAPAPTCSIDQDVGTVTSGKATSVTLTKNTTFTLSCSNSAGSNEATVRITTTPAPVAPTIKSFSAEPKTVTSGKATNVTWSWSYDNAPTPAPTCSIDQDVGTVTSKKTTSVTLANNTTFTLSCSNSAGSDEATVKITTFSTYTLAKSVNGTGGSISGGKSSPYNEGTKVTLTALPINGYTFDKWSVNGTTKTTNPITINMNSNKTVVVYFDQEITEDILVDYEISRACVRSNDKPDVVYQSLSANRTLVKDHVNFNCAFETFFEDATDLEKIEVSYDRANTSKQIFFNYDIPTSSFLEDFTMLAMCNCYYPISLTLKNFANLQDYTMNYDVAPIRDSKGAVVGTLSSIPFGDCDIPNGGTFTITEVTTRKHAINKSDYLDITGCIMSGGSNASWARDKISGGSYVENSSNGTLTVSIDEPSSNNVRKRTLFIELPDWDTSKDIPEIVISLTK